MGSASDSVQSLIWAQIGLRERREIFEAEQRAAEPRSSRPNRFFSALFRSALKARRNLLAAVLRLKAREPLQELGQAQLLFGP